jgi:hypothetical protein
MVRRPFVVLCLSVVLAFSATAWGGGIGGVAGKIGGYVSNGAKSGGGSLSNTAKSTGGSISAGFKNGVNTVSGGAQHVSSMVSGGAQHVGRTASQAVSSAGKRLGTSAPGKISVPSVNQMVNGAKKAGGQVSHATQHAGGVASGITHHVGHVGSDYTHHESDSFQSGSTYVDKHVGSPVAKTKTYFSKGHNDPSQQPTSNQQNLPEYGDPPPSSGHGMSGQDQSQNGDQQQPNPGGSESSGDSSGDGVAEPAQVAGAFLTSPKSTIHSSDLGQVVHRSVSALRRTAKDAKQRDALAPSMGTTVTRKNAIHSSRRASEARPQHKSDSGSNSVAEPSN